MIELENQNGGDEGVPVTRDFYVLFSMRRVAIRGDFKRKLLLQ